MTTPPPNDNYGAFWGDQYVKQNLVVAGNVSVGATLSAGRITNSSGVAALNIAKIAASALPVPYTHPSYQAFYPDSVGKARYIRQIVTQYDDGNYSCSGWTQVLNRFTNIPDFSAGSLVKLSYHVPCRNDNDGWGGAYLEPQISYNGGAKWWSLGSSGYDAVMNQGSAVGSYFQSILIDPYLIGVSAGAGFGVQIRFYARAYDGTTLINTDHNINAISGTAVLDPSINGAQHYAHIIVEELALLSGSV